MALGSGGKASYAPPSSVLEVIEKYRERGLHTPFDLDVLTKAGISKGLAPRTLQALKQLDLIDEGGNPTPRLKELGEVPEGEKQACLASMVRSAYAEVFRFTDPSRADYGEIRDAFMGFKPMGQRARMITLFLGLCEAAGIIDQAPKKSSQHRGRNRATGESQRLRRISEPPHLSTGLPVELRGLLESLPERGREWTSRQRDDFLEAFSAILRLCYPVKNGKPRRRDTDE